MTGAHTPSVADVLDAAADLLTPEGAWTQGTYGRDAAGVEVMSIQSATCFCAMGAMYKARGDVGEFTHDADLVKPLADVIERDCNMGIDDWNDDPSTTQAEVIAKLREAANAARATSKEAQGNG